YLLLLLGSTLFVDNSKDRVSSIINLIVKRAEILGEYAWGAGALAYLYRQLGSASQAEAKGVAGCLTLLQCWIYDHFPTLRPSRLEPRHLEQGKTGGTHVACYLTSVDKEEGYTHAGLVSLGD
ncbi:unnamed protein product, partial [Linum tenue]